MGKTSHMDESQVMVQMKDIVKKFGNFTANDHINLTVHKGEVHAILGENGAGKSTMMNVLCGLYKPTSGQIFIKGKEVHFSSPKDAIDIGIGMVHQHFMLIQPFTVTDNIILGIEPVKGLSIDKAAARQKVMELSERYGMKVDPDAKIEDISVGMQQRVEILKVLYRGADTLILDEPTASLTPQEIEGLMEIIENLESGSVKMLGKEVINKTPKETFESGISSIPADRQKHGLILDFSNEDNLILQHFEEAPFSNKGFLNRKAIRAHAAELIEKFDVRPRGCEEAPAGTLSGGNQQKVIIAREVTNDKDLLIAVNPTRGLDVGAIEFVHKYLVEQRNKNRAVLLVSFELDEIMSLSDRIEVIFDGRITGSVPGKNADEKELGYMMAGGRKNE